MEDGKFEIVVYKEVEKCEKELCALFDEVLEDRLDVSTIDKRVRQLKKRLEKIESVVESKYDEEKKEFFLFDMDFWATSECKKRIVERYDGVWRSIGNFESHLAERRFFYFFSKKGNKCRNRKRFFSFKKNFGVGLNEKNDF